MENNKTCQNCGEPILPTNKELRDDYRGDTYCERCSEDYWDEVILEEGENGKLLK